MKVSFVNIGQQYTNLRPKILKKFDEISKKGDFILGQELNLFEKEFAAFNGTKYSIGVGNGSDAITFSLLSLGIGKGDEVIISGNSFFATAWTVVNVGAKPIFVDVKDDFNIDPEDIIKKITKRTKAIIPVHLTGKMANMKKINYISKKFDLHIIEDAAQAIGASYKGKRSGSFGILGCFSLHPLKNLHVHGDGGVITTNNKDLCEYIKKLRNHGLKNRDECEFWGYNSRLDNINAAIARIKLKYINKWNLQFNNIAKKYSDNLQNYVIVPKERKNYFSVYHRYIIMHKERDKLKNYLLKNGIETKIHYPIPLHLQKATLDLKYKKVHLPNVERLSKIILSLPIYAEMPDRDVNYVIQKIKNF